MEYGARRSEYSENHEVLGTNVKVSALVNKAEFELSVRVSKHGVGLGKVEEVVRRVVSDSYKIELPDDILERSSAEALTVQRDLLRGWELVEKDPMLVWWRKELE